MLMCLFHRDASLCVTDKHTLAELWAHAQEQLEAEAIMIQQQQQQQLEIQPQQLQQLRNQLQQTEQRHQLETRQLQQIHVQVFGQLLCLQEIERRSSVHPLSVRSADRRCKV